MISVIVPAYNAERTISSTINSLLNQNYPKNRYEIIVVDDGSSDKTREIVRKFKKVRLIKQTHKGPAAARNLGAKKSKGNILLFTDSDCVPDKNWIKFVVEPFKNPEIVGVSGTYKTLNKESLLARFAGYEIEERHEEMEKQKNIDFIGTFSAAYRKKIFLRFGGFDEAFPLASGEDIDLSFKISTAGYKMVFQPKAFVYHNHPDNLVKYLRQKFFRGYWRVLLYNKHTKKMFKDVYTSKFLYVEIGLLGLSLLLSLLGILKIISVMYGALSFLLVVLLTLPFSAKIFKKDKRIGIIAPFIIILRNFSVGLGIVCGLELLIRKSKLKTTRTVTKRKLPA
jgi:cellulose synthase/poly-beta-1,6-N-acetylglucosamine synthase-like glycosyltransferase